MGAQRVRSRSRAGCGAED